MNYDELKFLIGNITFKVFHEVHGHFDYYFCFFKKNNLDKNFLSLIEKNQVIKKKEFQKICESKTADILEMSEDPENNVAVFFFEKLNIQDHNYVQQSLFIYKHVANIIAHKMVDSYFDEETFQKDFEMVVRNPNNFYYLKNGRTSPSGYQIMQGNYTMDYSEKEEKSKRGFEDVVAGINNSKESIDKIFDGKDLNYSERNKEKDFYDYVNNYFENTTSFIADALTEVSIGVKQKAPIVKKQAKVVGKYVGKKLIKAVQKGVDALEESKQKNIAIKSLDDDIFAIDSKPTKKQKR